MNTPTVNIKNRKTEQNYFHCYATANDRRFYLKDVHNLLRIKNKYSGLSKLVLFVAISEVRKLSFIDKYFVKILNRMFYKHPSIDLAEVYFKSNVGRDFSSYQTLLNKVKEKANADDFILFQNRSGYGPFRENWYSKFIEQFEKYDHTAICGSTINFKDHPERSLNNKLPHVQTYSFLTKLSYMNMFEGDFPGSKETDRYKIIYNGEIGLSQFFLNNKHTITCIEWPNKEISKQSEAITSLDIKTNVRAKHYFYHRTYFNKYRKGIINKVKYATTTLFNLLQLALKR